MGIIDCNITGGAESSYVGGLCGVSYGGVNNSYSTGLVSGYSDVGGLIGSGSTVSNSFSECTVSGKIDVGGFCGNSGGGMNRCYATGAVLGSDNASSIGGFCGTNIGTISDCYARGDVSVGNNSSRIGGFCGNNTSTVTIINCYSTGAVTAPEEYGYVGGLCGDNTYGSVVNSFWDVNSSGQASSDGGTGKTTAEMQTRVTFTDAGWDFVEEVINGTDDIWDICDGMNYPKLSWQVPPLGDFICPDGIEFVDFAVLAETWLLEEGEEGYNPVCDISNPTDEIIDMSDLEVFTENWLKQN